MPRRPYPLRATTLRNALLLATTAITFTATRPLGAQDAGAQHDAGATDAGVADGPLRDLEKEPPTDLGSKLEWTNDWSNEDRVMVPRHRFAQSLSWLDSHIDPMRCEFRVRADWLRVRCPGRTGRVNQIAGDTGESVVHISHQRDPDGKGGWVGKERLLVFVRLIPGNVSAFEITGVGSTYNGDWEGSSGILTVDWSDTEAGPRILAYPVMPGYALL